MVVMVMKESSKNKDIVTNKKKRIFMSCFFIVLAVLTIFSVTMGNASFSFEEFVAFVREANIFYLILAFGAMFLFVFFEGLALKSIASSFGYKKKARDGLVYSSADIYFSAITPSATGGQPMSAYFMHKDGIPGTIITITLLYNLMMYTSSFLVLVLGTFLIKPSIFLSLTFLSKLLIILGAVGQVGLFLGFYFLLYKDKLLEKLCSFGIKLGTKLHIIKNPDKYLNKLHKVMGEYKEYAAMIKSNKQVGIKALLYNVLQRLSQVGVVLFVFLATNGNVSELFSIWTIQLYVTLGAYCVPIPGGMGVSDYIMLDGFNNIMELNRAANLQLLSRTISFYCCIVICGMIVLVRTMKMMRGKKR